MQTSLTGWLHEVRCALLDFELLLLYLVTSLRTVELPSDGEPSSTGSELASIRNINQ
ncbi:hypothetical protein BKA83DRAFT_686328, partial [Pisolithus microcarpus]